MLENLVIVVHLLTAVAIVGLILLQQGKGADMGASFGSGSSQTVFGAAGSGNLLTHSTAILAAVFFATSLGLAVFAKHHADAAGGVDVIPVPAAVESAEGSGAQAPVVNEEVPAVPVSSEDVPQEQVPAAPQPAQ